MDVRDIVRKHYGETDLTDVILQALSEAGVDTEALTAEDLAPVDQLHAGFLPATRHLLVRLGLTPTSRTLDLGCGIGGPARIAATDHGCQVTGVDLTPEFVTTATELSDRVDLSGLVTFTCAPAESLPFADGTFDRAMMIHAGMNLPDKAAVFREAHRVLEPGGRFALFEQMRSGPGGLPYPLPWAEDDSSSFVETAEDYTAELTAAGFDVDGVEDRTAALAQAPPPGSRLSPQTIFGEAFVARIKNNVAAASDGLLTSVLMTATAL